MTLILIIFNLLVSCLNIYAWLRTKDKGNLFWGICNLFAGIILYTLQVKGIL